MAIWNPKKAKPVMEGGEKEEEEEEVDNLLIFCQSVFIFRSSPIRLEY